MVVVGLTGYIETPRGLKKVKSLFAEHLDESVIRRFYKRYRGKDHYRAFKKYQQPENWRKTVEKVLPILKKKSSVIRVLCHPKMKDIPHIRKIKAPLVEIQINGGTVDQKVEWGFSHFEKEVRVSDVFQTGDFSDVIGVTKGHGFEGVTARYGVRKLPRKTHKGLRKVGCIGGWHPERVRWTIARAGQNGYHHRTELNKRLYRIGQSARETTDNATTDADVTQKNITPLGGFPHYGQVLNDYVMLKGCTVGIRKRTLILRRSLFSPTLTGEQASINLKFIDTSSKFGHGRFQTVEEKAKFYGRKKLKKERKVLKKDLHKVRLAEGTK
jgi:large subunit ribosomal protein L3e